MWNNSKKLVKTAWRLMPKRQIGLYGIPQRSNTFFRLKTKQNKTKQKTKQKKYKIL